MSIQLPVIDAHAHIETTVSSRDLLDLDALVLAMTRTPAEWKQAQLRTDALTLWGIGAHPGLGPAIESFDADSFRAALGEAVIVGEVGLDGASKVPLPEQKAVFDEVLAAVQDQPRPISIHSVRASSDVLAALRARPVATPILHWWRGTRKETEEAVEMGCFFSLNGAEATRPRVMHLLPPDRVLTETDFPHSRRADRRAVRPASTQTIEAALSEAWGLDRLALRRRLWQTFGAVAEQADIETRLPARIQDILLTVGTASPS